MTQNGSSNFNLKDWNLYARCYDSLLELRPYQEMMFEVESLLPRQEGLKILDASCGTGNLALTLNKMRAETFCLTGIDSSKEMLSRAKEKMASLPSVSFVEGDLNKDLHFKSSSFDAVASINTLYAVEDVAFTLAQFRRVLRAGGNLVIVTPKRGAENGLILREHCNSNLPESFWLGIHQEKEKEERLVRLALQDEEVVSDMLLVAEYNRSIVRNSAFHFFEEEGLVKEVNDAGFCISSISMTYAKQAFILEAYAA